MRSLLPLFPALILLFQALPASAAERDIPPAFGPHLRLAPEEARALPTYKTSDRIVGTYYFYWYDAERNEHIVNHENGSDGLTDHPPTLKDFSYRSVTWHKQQLRDMMDAGIDLLLCVFWGAPSERDPKAALHWSYAGLGPLVQAREELLRENKQPPRIGLFYDTSTLQYNEWHYHADLTTDYGKRWFYATIRDFFSAIPPKHRATLEGKPITLLYAAAFARRHDQGFVDFTKQRFREEFGVDLYLAPQDSWQVKGDNTCAWGGALGLRNPGIGELGPGYDDTAVYGRKPLIAKREGGKFYENNWLKFLRRPSYFVMIETWNELHEGTDICESREYGRQYIDLTRKYSRLFKQGWAPSWPAGSFTGVGSVSLQAGDAARVGGITLVRHEDGDAKETSVEGSPAWSVKPFNGRSAYLYFRVDDSFKWAPQMNVRVEIEFFDAAPGRIGVEFDGSDSRAPLGGAYTGTPTETLKGDRTWKTASFTLQNAVFLGSQNGGADLRCVGETPTLFIRRIKLTR